jgi:hypothetical protein
MIPRTCLCSLPVFFHLYIHSGIVHVNLFTLLICNDEVLGRAHCCMNLPVLVRTVMYLVPLTRSMLKYYWRLNKRQFAEWLSSVEPPAGSLCMRIKSWSEYTFQAYALLWDHERDLQEGEEEMGLKQQETKLWPMNTKMKTFPSSLWRALIFEFP